MAVKKLNWSEIWRLVRHQHGVIARWQLLAMGMSAKAIDHRIARGRLRRMHRGVYAVGPGEISREGEWMAAVLACGEGAVLSHGSAAALWGIREKEDGPIEVSVCAYRRRPGIRVHRRDLARAHLSEHDRIPVTTPSMTLLDLSARLPDGALEAAVNQADKLDLVDPEALRSWISERSGERGLAKLRTLLDRRTFTLTDSELERRFIPIARDAGLPPPLTRQRVNGFRVDFYWPDLGLVVETDGLRYHRTPAQQSHDRVRDQTHTAAGLTPLRFTRAQVAFEPGYVRGILRRTADRLRGSALSSL